MTSADVSIEERLAFERLLAELSARFANVSSEDVETEIADALKQLIGFLGFDRSTFAEFTADGWISALCSVAADGVDPFPCGPLPKVFTWYVNKVRSGETVVFRRPEDLPPEAHDLAEYFRKSGLQSHVGIPFSVGGRVVAGIGFAGFNTSRQWPEDLILRLRILGKVFAQALERRREEQKLATAMAEIKSLKDRLEKENVYLKEVAQARLPQGLVSRSPRFNKVIEEISLVAPTGSTVLLLGETGTGKEVVAQVIHDLNGHKNRPMIKVNCAALPATLIEAELFGREKGAYTGALARQAGRFELADGSTLFLDEVGDLPLELQPKLLRVLQSGEFERVGGIQSIKVNVRVIAATNKNLSRAISQGEFREDLYYRLNVFPIEIPPLRERREDIPLLAWSFVKEFSKSMGKPIDRIAEELMAAMQAYPWPGNVRELRNVIERSMILDPGPTLHVALSRAAIRSLPSPFVGTLEEVERAQISKVLEECGWRIRGAGGAAAILDIKPTTLESRIKKLGLKRSD